MLFPSTPSAFSSKMNHDRTTAKRVLFAVTACHAFTALVVSSPDCHQQCTLIRSSLDPHRACKSSRRSSDQTLGRACEFGFNNGYLRVCMAMCRDGESDELVSPVETCARYDVNGATRKPRLACEAGQHCYLLVGDIWYLLTSGLSRQVIRVPIFR